ncbi:MAG: nucleoside phosphorylase [Christensenellaceae bacterium]|nr:nucleoside phosphorylase [Christensenellaceae bacterium]
MASNKAKKMYSKKSIKQILSQHEYLENIPPEGLFINGKPAVTGIDTSKVGEFVILTVRDALCAYGDDPAIVLSEKLKDVECIGKTEMFTSYSGFYKDAHITIVSGGSGSPEMEMILYDYMQHTNAGTYLRVGGSGGFGDDVEPGDIVISSGALRAEGMTQAYIEAGYPAASHYEVVCAMVEAAENIACRYHVGVTLSGDSDYVGCGRIGFGGYMQPWNIEKVGIYNRAGILNGDRESSAIITLSSLFGFRGGSVCSVSDNICTGKPFTAGVGHNYAMDIALEACSIMNEFDKQKNKHNKKYWYPNIDRK